ncbi:unnamed protein product [Allacma fusca]|uniref:Uncharacterized protein n=1 Tax=Allacma fusca TaxID=39272 RepID=A0A8J2J1D7_9HEXA|nr:unnamed protein product [Allacma fusca]
MKSGQKLSIVLLLAVCYIVNTTDGELIKCKTFDMKLSETGHNHLKECATAHGIASKKDMTPDKIPCFSKCIFEHKNLIDDKGKPHKENVLNILSDAVPEAMKGGLTTSLTKCLDDHGDGIDPTDEACQTYTPLAMCIHMVYLEICKPE